MKREIVIVSFLVILQIADCFDTKKVRKQNELIKWTYV